MKTMKYIAALVVSVVIGSAASAATVTSCDDITTLPQWDGCEVEIGSNLYGANAYDYNGDNLFGHSDWVVIEEGDGVSQTSFAYPDGEWDAIALLIKAGNGVLGLLYNTENTLSNWMTGGLSITDISHDVSGYLLLGREGDTSVVPLPAAGWLLLAGLGGMVALGRRRKSA